MSSLGFGDEDVDMEPVRRRANKKRRVRTASSSVDEEDVGMEEATTPVKRTVLQPLPSGENQDPRLSEEQTAVSDSKPPRDAAAGKKWAKVKKTEQTMDAKGYLVFKDVEVWEEVDDIKPAKRAPPKSAGVKAPEASAPPSR